MRGTIATIIGTVVCLAGLAAWCYTAPAQGSGWILFVAFLGTLGLLDSIREIGLATAAGLAITAASGAVWWTHRGVEDVGWVLFLCILCGFCAVNSLSAMVGSETRSKKK